MRRTYYEGIMQEYKVCRLGYGKLEDYLNLLPTAPGFRFLPTVIFAKVNFGTLKFPGKYSKMDTFLSFAVNFYPSHII